MAEHAQAHGAAEAAPLGPSGAEGPRAQLTVTDKAAAKLKELLAQEKKGPEYGLRLGIQGGGCSGFSYFMDFDAEKPGDRVFEDAAKTVKVFVDPKSLLYMSGSVLDFSEGLMGSGFSIKNPMAKGSCGCGHSFNV
ncbi:MAG: iron-sulfur cluster assembly accessory protein [Planctomycetes bacterium]|nr:iron-sulfur cluster assembly accessory protein [Planctomycetota bacterium]